MARFPRYQELGVIAEACRRHDVYVLSDEVYARIVYGTAAGSIAAPVREPRPYISSSMWPSLSFLVCR